MTTSDIERPWLQVEVTPDVRKRSLSDEIVEILEVLFTGEVDDALRLATAPDDEDSVTGSTKYDRVLLAAAVKRMATGAQPQVQAALVKQIVPLVNRCAARIGVDRKAIAAKKSETLALQEAEAIGEQAEQSTNSRRGWGNGSTEGI